MLYQKDRHSPLGNLRWHAGAASDFIGKLFRLTETDFDPEMGWSKNKPQAEQSGPLRFSLYDGDAGVAWSQARLCQWGYGKVRDYGDFLARARPLHLAALKKELAGDEYLAGLLMGDLGLLVAERVFHLDEPLLQAIFSCIEALKHNPVCEYMWGAPGALAVAAALAKTRAEFIGLAIEVLDTLQNQLGGSERLGVKIWQQNLYGDRVVHLGAVHGFAGNAFSIIKALPLLDDQAAQFWKSLIMETIAQTALLEGDLANWPQSIDGQRPGRDAILVQFCHGSPGVACCLAGLMGENSDFDQLMLAGGELAWQAGPVNKGVGLCHGVAGTGYCFLKLFTATGDERWLERAQSFAAFALQQATTQLELTGHFHYSLWNGDHGLAHLVHHCLNQTSDIPTLDYF